MITKEFLENKIKEFKAQKDSAIASANACEGAIQAYEHLIKELKTEEVEID